MQIEIDYKAFIERYVELARAFEVIEQPFCTGTLSRNECQMFGHYFMEAVEQLGINTITFRPYAKEYTAASFYMDVKGEKIKVFALFKKGESLYA